MRVPRRGHAVPGSIPAVLDIFRSEVRFYQEIAPVVGSRVPACYQCEETSQGTVLEDLSAWQPGADPVAAAGVVGVAPRVGAAGGRALAVAASGWRGG